MPAPLDPAKREAIADAIRAGELGRNEIARQFDVAAGTVTAIAQQDGIDGAFDRSATKDATEARGADLAARKAELAKLLMEDAFWLRARFREESFQGMDGRGEDAEPIYALPDGRNTQAFMVAIGIAVDKIGVLTRDDAQGLAAVDAWLRSLGVGQTTA